ncbi:NAD(P)-binding domain-containing protein, partial [Aliarcobacter butzleri]|nr:NAD(P)-binding domain-containing protein [Aliarcobacter butzleri]
MKFTILGAGWLGFELAKSLKNKYKIVVSSRDEEKLKIYEDEGFSSYILNEQNFDYIEELLNTDFLFINFPPSKFENYLSFLEKIYSSKNISNIRKIIFISSTSIYPNINGIFTEISEINNPSSQIV